ncbi:hypothetical protein F4679DRAFT_596577 [Xylaria curta]|nr:hypothetical protein F4679DRAFT_596577 [Xylaria curta]
MASNNQEPFTARYDLARQYKAIERQTIPSLFKNNAGWDRWSKAAVLARLTVEHTELDSALKANAAESLNEAANLRKQAMPLYPTGTPAASRHWDWIGILERMVDLLQSKEEDAPSISDRSSVVDDIPDIDTLAIGDDGEKETVAEPIMTHKRSSKKKNKGTKKKGKKKQGKKQAKKEEKKEEKEEEDEQPLWVTDFELYLQQLVYWRDNIIKAWKNAKEDPEKMALANISVGCAINYIRREVELTMEIHPDFFEEDGAYSSDVLEYLAKKESNGIGAGFIKAIESIKAKGFAKETERIMDQANYKTFKDASWICGDLATYHMNPLAGWLNEVMKNDPDRRPHPDMIFCWMLITDSENMLEETERMNMIQAAVERMTELVQDVKKYEIIYPKEFVDHLAGVISLRVKIFHEYALKQKSVPGLAIIYMWVKYCTIMINIYALVAMRALKQMALFYEAQVILKRSKKIAASRFLERFCNRYRTRLYLSGERPNNAQAWRQEVCSWYDMLIDSTAYSKILSPKSKIHETYRSWVRWVIEHGWITPKEDGFFMPPGTTSWWRAISEHVEKDFSEPCVMDLYKRVHEAGVNGPNLDTTILTMATTLDWKAHRARVMAQADKMKFEIDWFSSIKL